MNMIFTLLIFLFMPSIIISQPKLKSNDFLDKIITAEGISNVNEINDYQKIYYKIYSDAKNEVNDEDNIYDKHESIFNLLHDHYLKKYSAESYFSGLLKNGEYNCLTSVILYYMICSDLGLKINIYRTPFHVYISVNDEKDKKFIIELTDPVDGFDFDRNEDDIIDYLLDYKMITEKELKEKGRDKIYSEFVSNSKQIDPGDLISLYYSNLAHYYSAKDMNYRAYKLIKKAVTIDPDSINILTHNLIWMLNALKLEDNKDSLTSFLLETMDTIPSSEKFQDLMIEYSSYVIDFYVDAKNFELADSVYNKLCSVLPEKKLAENTIKEMYVEIEKHKIISSAVRGELEYAFLHAGNLFNKYHDNQDLLELYVNIGNSYMRNLAFSGDYEKMKSTGDSLFQNAPGIKSVEQIFAESNVLYVMNTGLYKTDTKKAQRVLLRANKKLPNNKVIKRGLGMIYHEFAMAEIRNRDYRKAVAFLKEGLKYDPNSFDLKHEVELTKALIHK